MKINVLIDSIKTSTLFRIEEMKKQGLSESQIQKVKDECNECIRLSLMCLRIDDDGNIIVNSRTGD